MLKNKITLTILIIFMIISSYLLFRVLGIHLNIIVMSSYIIFTVFLSSRKIYFWFLLFPIVFIVSIYLPIGFLFGPITSEYLISVYSTNNTETSDFLSKLPIKYICYSLLIISSYIFWGIVVVNKRYIKIKNTRIKFLCLLASILFLLKLTFFVDLYFSTKEAYKELNVFTEQIKRNDWEIIGVNNKYKNYVLILGESGSKFYHGVYNHKIDTTPFLSSVNSVIVDGMLSPATHTIPSLTKMLTLQKNFTPQYNLNIIDLVNDAGFTSYWISNQNYVGQYETPNTSIGIKSKHYYFQKNFDATTTTDYDLLPVFKDMLKKSLNNKRNFFVIHLHDLHPYEVCDVVKRYKKYGYSVIQTTDYNYINCYMSIVTFTDKLIHGIYDSLEETGQSFSIIYISDHGIRIRNTTDKNSQLMHSDKQEGYHIPLIKISSDDKSKKIIQTYKTGLFFTNGLSTWMGIDTKNIDKKYDLFIQSKFDNAEEKNHIEKVISLPLQNIFKE